MTSNSKASYGVPGADRAAGLQKEADNPGGLPVDTTNPGPIQGKSLTAGIAGSVIASMCCIPQAVAIAFGLGLSTVASLGQLLEYQRFFQVGGLAFMGLMAWRMLRRRGAACSMSQRERDRVPVLIMASFAASFVVLNVVVIPLLERMP